MKLTSVTVTDLCHLSERKRSKTQQDIGIQKSNHTNSATSPLLGIKYREAA